MLSLRERDRSKEVGYNFTVRAKSQLERVWDAIKDRSSLYLDPKEMSKKNVDKMFKEAHDTKSARRGPSPKDILPTFHEKTYFKGATGLYLQNEKSLDISDGRINDIIQQINVLTGRRKLKF